MEHLNNISWQLGDDLDKVKYFLRKENKLIKIPKEIWTEKLPIKKGDKVAIWYEDLPNYEYKMIPETAEPIQGNTIGALITAYNKGSKRIIPAPVRSDLSTWYFNPKERKFPIPRIIYEKIADFYDQENRRRLVKLYESGKLTHKKMYSCPYFEGAKRGSKGIWEISVGT